MTPNPSREHASIKRAYLDWRCQDLLRVPPVDVMSYEGEIPFRQLAARFIDGRHVNDALFRAVVAIRREYSLAPGPYVVTYPNQGFEIPIDLRAVEGEDVLAAIAYPPRSITGSPIDFSQLAEPMAARLRQMSRDEVVQALKEHAADGELELADACGGAAFFHHFCGGTYRHSYRYVATGVPELER